MAVPAATSSLVSLLSDPATLVGLSVVAAGAAYYVTRPTPIRFPVPLDNQSLELPKRERASRLLKSTELLPFRFDDATTMYEIFMRGKRVSDNGQCLGWRTSGTSPYQWINYSEVELRAHALGSGLKELKIATGQGAFVGIYAQNCVEWVVTELSCNMFSRVSVPLYDTLGPEAATFIINQVSMPVVVCGANKVAAILKQAKHCPSLKLVVKIGAPPTKEEAEQADAVSVTLKSFEEVVEIGKGNLASREPPTPEDLLTICYTSGTTGNPKGAMLTHANLVSNLSAIYVHLESYLVISPADSYISYLPLAHMLERLIMGMVFMVGARAGFFRGDVKELMTDIQELKPTVFVSVPRLLNRVYDKMISTVSASPVKKWLYETAFASKMAELRRGVVRNDSIWDWLIFNRVQKGLGGRVKFIATGSAPISGKVLDFLRVACGCLVFEGYGQTECTAGASATLVGEHESGHVGPPLTCNYIKLMDVKDMNYFAENNEGEICFKGHNIFKGYYNDKDKTAEVLDADGWLHSGDIGRWLPNGVLKIIDRKKHIFKLSQGEYIAPEKVENIYIRCKFVAQVFVYGDSLKSCCIGVVAPNEEHLATWAKENGRNESFRELCADHGVKEMILKEMTEFGKKNGLSSLEQVKGIVLFPEGFTVENELLTPTFKMKRPELKKRFMEDIFRPWVPTQCYSPLLHNDGSNGVLTRVSLKADNDGSNGVLTRVSLKADNDGSNGVLTRVSLKADNDGSNGVLTRVSLKADNDGSNGVLTRVSLKADNDGSNGVLTRVSLKADNDGSNGVLTRVYLKADNDGSNGVLTRVSLKADNDGSNGVLTRVSLKADNDGSNGVLTRVSLKADNDGSNGVLTRVSLKADNDPHCVLSSQCKGSDMW
ncbi:hypothetical protein EMCRGX_G021180 [Ephydatia muelleri]